MSDETRTPNEHTVKSIFVRAHPFALTTSHEERRAEFDRFVSKIKAESWAEGYEAGCSSPYGTATPSGKPYDPEPNPYRIEEEA